MTRKRRRLVLIGGALGVLAVAVALMLNALRDSIVFFNSPSDVAEKHIAAGTRIRIGGLVKPGSVTRGDNLKISFDVTDGDRDIAVAYRAYYLICSARAKAGSPKARSTAPGTSTPTPSLPNTTKPTCPKKSPTR